MKAFEIKAETVDIYMGYHSGYEIIGYAHTREGAEKYAEQWAEETMKRPQWWIGYGTRNGKLYTEITEKYFKFVD